MTTEEKSYDVLKAGDLEFNLVTKSVRRGGVPLYLSAIEMQLLEFLLRRKNQVVTKTDIAINVSIIELETELVEGYIDALREKIDNDFVTPLLKSAPGRGFFIMDEG